MPDRRFYGLLLAERSGVESPHADFVRVPEEIARVLFHSIRACSLELLFAVAAREQPHAR